MESAIDRITGDIIEAEQLWLIENVDNERYVCRGCGAKAIPSSYRPENVVRPYFKSTHTPDCDVTGESKLIARGRKEKLGSRLTGFPAPYPSRLVLVDEREVVDGLPRGGRTIPPEADGRPRGGGGAPGVQRRRSAGTIRPICRAFINFPYDRYLDLIVPGIDATTYAQVFKKLKPDEVLGYPDTKIFYAPIRWTAATSSDEYLEATLNAGAWEEKKLAKPYRVRVKWEDWSKSKRSYVANELEAARKEVIVEAKKKSAKKGYIFFIGKQDSQDSALFHVDDHRLICCLVDEII